MTGWFSVRNIVIVALLAALLLLPVYVELGGNRVKVPLQSLGVPGRDQDAQPIT